MQMYIYPKYNIGQKVKAYQNPIINGKISNRAIVVYGVVKEIIIGRDFIFDQLYYMYRLDSGEIFSENILIERRD
jgi:hypothetical protein